MTLTQLISTLQLALTEHGDLEVLVPNGAWFCDDRESFVPAHEVRVQSGGLVIDSE